jgi:hypothetical protein
MVETGNNSGGPYLARALFGPIPPKGAGMTKAARLTGRPAGCSRSFLRSDTNQNTIGTRTQMVYLFGLIAMEGAVFFRIAAIALLIAAGAAWMFRYDVLQGSRNAFILDRWTGKMILCIEDHCAPLATFMPLPRGIIPKPRKE